MPRINKPLKVKKVKVAKTKKQVKKPKVKVSRKKQAQIKNPVIYFGCMQSAVKQGIKPKKITEIAHECKTNALTVKKKISAQKLKEVKKLGDSFNEFKKNLGEFVKKSVK